MTYQLKSDLFPINRCSIRAQEMAFKLPAPLTHLQHSLALPH